MTHELALTHLWLPPLRCRALGLRRSHSVWDDAVQEGNLGLLKAAERFDAERGVRFEHYARPWVDNAIKLCFCAQQVVSEPIKRVARRAAAGERAHPSTVREVDQLESEGGGEDALASAIDQARREAWLRERLAEVDPRQRIALLAIARGAGVCEYARRARVSRETVRLRTNAGLEYLRESARQLEGGTL